METGFSPDGAGYAPALWEQSGRLGRSHKKGSGEQSFAHGMGEKGSKSAPAPGLKAAMITNRAAV